MEKVIRFIHNFLTQEYEVMIQMRTEPDVLLTEHNLNSLNQFFQELHSGLNLSSSRTMEERTTVIRQLQPRILFQINQYVHASLGTIYRVYLSSPFWGDNNYYVNFYVVNTEKGLKIVSRYIICYNCNGTGYCAELLCDECQGFGWNWRGGKKIESLGKLVTERKFKHTINREQ